MENLVNDKLYLQSHSIKMIFSFIKNYVNAEILLNQLIYKIKTCRVANSIGLLRSSDVFVVTQKDKLLFYISYGDSR